MPTIWVWSADPPIFSGAKVSNVLSKGTRAFGAGWPWESLSRSSIPSVSFSVYVSPYLRPPTGSMVSDVTLLDAVTVSRGTASPAAFTPTPASLSVGLPPLESTSRTFPGTFVTGSENVTTGNTLTGTPAPFFLGTTEITPGGPGRASVVLPPAASTRNTICSVIAGPKGGRAVAVTV